MKTKIEETKIWNNDRLIKFDDGSFRYIFSGDRLDFSNSDSLYSWLSEDGVDVSAELEAFIDN